MSAKNLGNKDKGINRQESSFGLLRVAGFLPDCVFLTAVEVLSLIAYAPRIGFYTDDYAFLSIFKGCQSQSFPALFRCLYSGAPNTHSRPVQMFCLTALYKLAGVHPIGSQIFIAVFLIATVLMFYAVLREMQAPRLLALSVPLIFGLLPHYSTDRFWMASSQSFASMFFGFLCFYCVLRSASASHSYRWWWQLASIAALLASALAYEICVPLFALLPFLYWYQAKKMPRNETPAQAGLRKGSVIYFYGVALLLVVLVSYKLISILGSLHWRFLHRIPEVIEQGVLRAIGFNYGYYGLGLPAVAWNAIRFYPSTGSFILAGLLASVILIYFFRIARRTPPFFPRTSSWVKLLGLGLVVYGLGYAPFFAYRTLYLTSTDPENRIVLGAAVGAAISIVAVIGCASSLARSSHTRARIFTALVVIFAVSGFLIVNAIADFWVRAYRQQNAVLASIRTHIPVLPAGSVLILDGVCPSVGPAPVFEFDYDLAGALSIEYGDPHLRADVVSPVMKVGAKGLTSSTYGYVDEYMYGNKLIVFNARKAISVPLTSADVALGYFHTHDPAFNGECQPARLSPSIYPFTKDGIIGADCRIEQGTR